MKTNPQEGVGALERVSQLIEFLVVSQTDFQTGPFE